MGYSGIPGAAGGAGGGGGGGSDVIWTWNGADLSQFRQLGTPELDTSGGAAITVVTSLYGQSMLRVTGGGANANAFSQWVLSTSEFTDPIPTRYVLEIHYAQAQNGAGGLTNSSWCGFSHFCRYNSPGNVRAWTFAQNGASNSHAQLFTRDTTFSTAGTTPPGTAPSSSSDRGAFHRLTMAQDRRGGADPFDIYLRGRYWGSSNSEVLDVNNDSNQLDFDAGAYDGLTPNTFGIAARWDANAAHFFDISTLRVIKHPADCTVS